MPTWLKKRMCGNEYGFCLVSRVGAFKEHGVDMSEVLGICLCVHR